MAMDIADSSGKYYLIEFQFFPLGNYALEKSSFYFKKVSNEWQIIRETSQLESVFVDCIDRHINNNH